MGQFDKIKFKGVNTVWATPPELFNPLNEEFSFTLDVAADKQNRKVKRYFDEETNGLEQSWKNEVCWCNPPFGRIVPKWVEKEKVESDNGATSILLLLAKTNTKWFHELCMTVSEIRFVKGRPKFIGAKYGLPFPLMLVIFKPNETEPCKIGSYDWKSLNGIYSE